MIYLLVEILKLFTYCESGRMDVCVNTIGDV